MVFKSSKYDKFILSLHTNYSKISLVSTRSAIYSVIYFCFNHFYSFEYTAFVDIFLFHSEYEYFIEISDS